MPLMVLVSGFLLQETSLELVAVGKDGIVRSICEQDVFGIIKDIGVLQWHFRRVGSIPQVLLSFTPNINLQSFLVHIPVLILFKASD